MVPEPAMRITIRPAAAPDREIDIAPALIAAIAHELWRHTGGNEVLNWLEAERVVAKLAQLPRRSAGRARAARHARAEMVTKAQDQDRHTGPIPVLTAR